MGLQVVVSFNGRPVGKWALDRPHMGIGRAPENEIQLDAQVVSRRHAVIERVEGSQPVRDGDSIQIGAFSLLIGGGEHSTSINLPPRKDRSGEGWIATTSIRVSPEERLERERAATVRAYLILNGSPGPRLIEKDVYQIGKDAACDLRLEGVFAPRKLALIVRGHGGWKLVNVTPDGKRVERNGAAVADQTWLDDGDRLLLHDTEVAFHEGAP